MPTTLRGPKYSDYVLSYSQYAPRKESGEADLSGMLSEEAWNALPEAERVDSTRGGGYDGGQLGFELDPNDEYAQQFRAQFGATPEAITNSGFEVGNQRQTGLRYGYANENGVMGPQYGRVAWDQLAIDPSRILWLDPEGTPNRRYVYEAENARGDQVAGEQSRVSNSGLGDNAGLIMLATVLGAGAFGELFAGGEFLGGSAADLSVPGLMADMPALPELPGMLSASDVLAPGFDTAISLDAAEQVAANAYQSPFDHWLESYVSDAGSTQTLPFGEESYFDLGMDPGATTSGVYGNMDITETPWWERLGSKLVDKLPQIANASRFLTKPSASSGGSGGLPGGGGGGSGGFGGGKGGMAFGDTQPDPTKLKQILSLAEYIAGRRA